MCDVEPDIGADIFTNFLTDGGISIDAELFKSLDCTHFALINNDAQLTTSSLQGGYIFITAEIIANCTRVMLDSGGQEKDTRGEVFSNLQVVLDCVAHIQKEADVLGRKTLLLGDNSLKFDEILKTSSREYAANIAQLADNQALYIPAGTRQHALLYEFRKQGNKIVFIVYNTGAGLENHEQQMNFTYDAWKNKSFPCYAVEFNAPKNSDPEDPQIKHLACYLEELLSMYFRQHLSDSELISRWNDNAQALYTKVLPLVYHLEGGGIVDPKQLVQTNFITGQRSGKCSEAVFHPLIKNLFKYNNQDGPKKYQRFMVTYRKITIAAFCQNEENLRDPVAFAEINQALSNLASRTYKNRQYFSRPELQGIKDFIDHCRRKVSSVSPTLSIKAIPRIGFPPDLSIYAPKNITITSALDSGTPQIMSHIPLDPIAKLEFLVTMQQAQLDLIVRQKVNAEIEELLLYWPLNTHEVVTDLQKGQELLTKLSILLKNYCDNIQLCSGQVPQVNPDYQSSMLTMQYVMTIMSALAVMSTIMPENTTIKQLIVKHRLHKILFNNRFNPYLGTAAHKLDRRFVELLAFFEPFAETNDPYIDFIKTLSPNNRKLLNKVFEQHKLTIFSKDSQTKLVALNDFNLDKPYYQNLVTLIYLQDKIKAEIEVLSVPEKLYAGEMLAKFLFLMQSNNTIDGLGDILSKGIYSPTSLIDISKKSYKFTPEADTVNKKYVWHTKFEADPLAQHGKLLKESFLFTDYIGKDNPCVRSYLLRDVNLVDASRLPTSEIQTDRFLHEKENFLQQQFLHTRAAPSVQIPATVNFFTANMELLANSSWQQLCKLNLFQPLVVYNNTRDIQQEKQARTELLKFLQWGLQINVKENYINEQALFFVQIQALCLGYWLDAGIDAAEYGAVLKELNGNLSYMLENRAYKNYHKKLYSIKAITLKSLLLHCKDLKPNVYKNYLKEYMLAKFYMDKEYTKEVMLQHEFGLQLEKTLSQDPGFLQQAFQDFIQEENLFPGRKNFSNYSIEYPHVCVTIEDVPPSRIIFDINTGSMYKNGRQLLPISQVITQHSIFKELFADQVKNAIHIMCSGDREPSLLEIEYNGYKYFIKQSRDKGLIFQRESMQPPMTRYELVSYEQIRKLEYIAPKTLLDNKYHFWLQTAIPPLESSVSASTISASRQTLPLGSYVFRPSTTTPLERNSFSRQLLERNSFSRQLLITNKQTGETIYQVYDMTPINCKISAVHHDGMPILTVENMIYDKKGILGLTTLLRFVDVSLLEIIEVEKDKQYIINIPQYGLEFATADNFVNIKAKAPIEYAGHELIIDPACYSRYGIKNMLLLQASSAEDPIALIPRQFFIKDREVQQFTQTPLKLDLSLEHRQFVLQEKKDQGKSYYNQSTFVCCKISSLNNSLVADNSADALYLAYAYLGNNEPGKALATLKSCQSLGGLKLNEKELEHLMLIFTKLPARVRDLEIIASIDTPSYIAVQAYLGYLYICAKYQAQRQVSIDETKVGLQDERVFMQDVRSFSIEIEIAEVINKYLAIKNNIPAIMQLGKAQEERCLSFIKDKRLQIPSARLAIDGLAQEGSISIAKSYRNEQEEDRQKALVVQQQKIIELERRGFVTNYEVLRDYARIVNWPNELPAQEFIWINEYCPCFNDNRDIKSHYVLDPVVLKKITELLNPSLTEPDFCVNFLFFYNLAIDNSSQAVETKELLKNFLEAKIKILVVASVNAQVDFSILNGSHFMVLLYQILNQPIQGIKYPSIEEVFKNITKMEVPVGRDLRSGSSVSQSIGSKKNYYASGINVYAIDKEKCEFFCKNIFASLEKNIRIPFLRIKTINHQVKTVGEHLDGNLQLHELPVKKEFKLLQYSGAEDGGLAEVVSVSSSQSFSSTSRAGIELAQQALSLGDFLREYTDISIEGSSSSLPAIFVDDELKSEVMAGRLLNEVIAKKRAYAKQQLQDVSRRERLLAVLQEKASKLNNSIAIQEVAILEMLNNSRAGRKKVIYDLGILGSMLTEQDEASMINLYLLGDEQSFMQATGLNNDKSSHPNIYDAYNAISEYLLIKNEQQHVQNIITKLEEIGTSKEPDEFALKNLADLLVANNCVSLDRSELRALQVFQYARKTLLRLKQADYLSKHLELIDGNYKNVMSQLPMGFGKTFLLPIIAKAKADGTRLVVIEVPPALFTTNLRDFSSVSTQFMHQVTQGFKFTRATKCNAEDLHAMYDFLVSIKQRRDYLVITGDTVASLNLRYHETLKNISQQQNPSEELLEQSFWLGRIVKMFKMEADALIDEVHSGLNVKKKLIYAIEEENLGVEQIEITTELYKFLLPKQIILLERKFTLEELMKSPGLIAADEIKEVMQQVVKFLVDDMDGPLRGIINATNQETIRQYLIYELIAADGQIVPILPHLFPSALDKLALIKAQVCELWPITLAKEYRKGYGLLPDERNLRATPYAVPFVASNTPNVLDVQDGIMRTTQFDALETLIYTIQAYIAEGVLPEFMVIEAIQKLKELASSECLRDKKANYAETENGQLFKEFVQESGIDDITLDNYAHHEHYSELITHLQKNRAFLFHVLKSRVLPTIRVEKKLLEHDSSQHVHLYKSCQGIGGTTDNYASIDMLFDPKDSLGTNGAVIDLVLQKTSSIQVIPASQRSSEFLLEKAASNKEVHAIIDAGGLFSSMSNEAVAKSLAEKLRANSQRVPAIRYVLFFDKENCLSVVNVVNGSIEIIGSSDKEALRTRLGSENNWVTFYDEAHAEGTDIVQHPQAEAIITIGYGTTISKFLQASMRMRELPQGQRLSIFMEENIAHLCNKTAEPLTLQQIIEFLFSNTKAVISEESFRYVLQAMDNLLYQEILLNLLDTVPNDGTFDPRNQVLQAEKLHRFNEVTNLFIKTKSSSLYELYGKLSQVEDMETILQQHQDKLTQLRTKLVEQELLEAKGEQKFTEKMTTLIAHGKRHCQPRILYRGDTSTGRELERETQTETQQQTQQQTQNQSQKQTQNQSTLQEQYIHAEEYVSWIKDHIVELNSDSGALCKFIIPIHTLHVDFDKFGIGDEDQIYISKNHAKMYHEQACYLDAYRLPLQYVLIMKDKEVERNKLRTIIITPHELEELLKQDTAMLGEFWVESPTGTLICGNQPQGIQEDVQYLRIKEKLKFINGDLKSLFEQQNIVWFIKNHEDKLKFIRQQVLLARADQIQLNDEGLLKYFREKRHGYESYLLKVFQGEELADQTMYKICTQVFNLPDGSLFAGLSSTEEKIIKLLTTFVDVDLELSSYIGVLDQAFDREKIGLYQRIYGYKQSLLKMHISPARLQTQVEEQLSRFKIEIDSNSILKEKISWMAIGLLQESVKNNDTITIELLAKIIPDLLRNNPDILDKLPSISGLSLSAIITNFGNDGALDEKWVLPLFKQIVDRQDFVKLTVFLGSNKNRMRFAISQELGIQKLVGRVAENLDKPLLEKLVQFSSFDEEKAINLLEMSKLTYELMDRFDKVITNNLSFIDTSYLSQFATRDIDNFIDNIYIDFNLRLVYSCIKGEVEKYNRIISIKSDLSNFSPKYHALCYALYGGDNFIIQDILAKLSTTRFSEQDIIAILYFLPQKIDSLPLDIFLKIMNIVVRAIKEGDSHKHEQALNAMLEKISNNPLVLHENKEKSFYLIKELREHDETKQSSETFIIDALVNFLTRKYTYDSTVTFDACENLLTDLIMISPEMDLLLVMTKIVNHIEEHQKESVSVFYLKTLDAVMRVAKRLLAQEKTVDLSSINRLIQILKKYSSSEDKSFILDVMAIMLNKYECNSDTMSIFIDYLSLVNFARDPHNKNIQMVIDKFAPIAMQFCKQPQILDLRRKNRFLSDCLLKCDSVSNDFIEDFLLNKFRDRCLIQLELSDLEKAALFRWFTNRDLTVAQYKQYLEKALPYNNTMIGEMFMQNLTNYLPDFDAQMIGELLSTAAQSESLYMISQETLKCREALSKKGIGVDVLVSYFNKYLLPRFLGICDEQEQKDQLIAVLIKHQDILDKLRIEIQCHPKIFTQLLLETKHKIIDEYFGDSAPKGSTQASPPFLFVIINYILTEKDWAVGMEEEAKRKIIVNAMLKAHPFFVKKTLESNKELLEHVPLDIKKMLFAGYLEAVKVSEQQLDLEYVKSLVDWENKEIKKQVVEKAARKIPPSVLRTIIFTEKIFPDKMNFVNIIAMFEATETIQEQAIILGYFSPEKDQNNSLKTVMLTFILKQKDSRTERQILESLVRDDSFRSYLSSNIETLVDFKLIEQQIKGASRLQLPTQLLSKLANEQEFKKNCSYLVGLLGLDKGSIYAYVQQQSKPSTKPYFQ